MTTGRTSRRRLALLGPGLALALIAAATPTWATPAHGDGRTQAVLVRELTPGNDAAEQALVPGSELRVIEDVHGHAALFGLGADYAKQVDGALSDLLGTSV